MGGTGYLPGPVMARSHHRGALPRRRLQPLSFLASALTATLVISLGNVVGASSLSTSPSFWETVAQLTNQQAAGGAPSVITSSCPYRYYFLFQVASSESGVPVDVDAVRNVLTGDEDSLRRLFSTATTGPGDACSINLLSSSTKGASVAVAQAKQSNGATVFTESEDDSGTQDSSQSLWSLLTVRGSAAMSGIKLQDVSSNLARQLGSAVTTENGDSGPSVVTTMSSGKIAELGAAAASLPPRTHTFKSYQSSSLFSSYLPVIFADTTFSGTLSATSDIVDLAAGQTLTNAQCRITKAYRSPRGKNDYTLLTGGDSLIFSLTRKGFAVNSPMALRITMAWTRFYSRLTNTPGAGGSAATKLLLSYLTGSSTTATGEATTGGGFRHDRKTQTQSLDGDVSVQNFATSDYIQDYALLFTCSYAVNAPVHRLDFTLVPKIKRTAATTAATSLLCEPGLGPGLTSVDKYMPRLSAGPNTCPTTRSHPYLLSSSSFKELHPEEYAWVTQRVLALKPKVAAYIQAQLGLTLNTSYSVPKIAVAVSGGGKRSLLNAAGVLAGLNEAGVMDLATWTSGISGGAWLISALHAKGKGGSSLPDAGDYVRSITTELRKAVFDETFRSNEILTNFGNSVITLPVPTFNPQNAGQYTNAIQCQGELKLQSPGLATSSYGSPSLFEYYSRAVSYQILSGMDDAGLGLTFSDLAKGDLLANYKAGLPIIQIQQNLGDGTDNSAYRLWEASPFDMAVHKGNNVHVSFPTSLLGTDTKDSNKRCMTGHDQLSNLFGMSSFAFPLANDLDTTVVTYICGERGSICQPIPLQNPFYAHPELDANDPEVSAPKVALIADGGLNFNVPVQAFATPTRQADILVAVDSSAWTKDPRFSSKPPYTCDTDALSGRCPTKNFYKNGSSTTSCCNNCNTTLGYYCWGTSHPDLNDVFSIPAEFPEHTLPSEWPRTASDTVGLLNKVTFFGCDENDKTAVVYIPNRIVTSGKSGFPVDLGVFDINPQLGLQKPPLTATDIDDILKNGKAQVTSSPTFAKCFACLTAATQAGRSDFWNNNAGCAACYSAYCYRRPV